MESRDWEESRGARWTKETGEAKLEAKMVHASHKVHGPKHEVHETLQSGNSHLPVVCSRPAPQISQKQSMSEAQHRFLSQHPRLAILIEGGYLEEGLAQNQVSVAAWSAMGHREPASSGFTSLLMLFC